MTRHDPLRPASGAAPAIRSDAGRSWHGARIEDALAARVAAPGGLSR